MDQIIVGNGVLRLTRATIACTHYVLPRRWRSKCFDHHGADCNKRDGHGHARQQLKHWSNSGQLIRNGCRKLAPIQQRRSYPNQAACSVVDHAKPTGELEGSPAPGTPDRNFQAARTTRAATPRCRTASAMTISVMLVIGSEKKVTSEYTPKMVPAIPSTSHSKPTHLTGPGA